MLAKSIIIHHRMRRFFACIIIASGLFLSRAWAQEASLNLNAPSEVYAGQVFEVSYSVNVKGSKSFQAPAFKGLDLLFGPMQSQSSSLQFINGKRSQSFTLSYTYQLRAPQEGDFNFGKASIVVNGEKIYSEEFRLKVLPANQPAANHIDNSTQRKHPDDNSRNSNERQENSTPTVAEDDLFVVATPSQRTPYVGEQVLLSYRIYTCIPVEQFSIYKTPSNKGFWIEEISTPSSNNQKEEFIDGKKYISANILKVALFPQKEGSYKLEPIEVEALAQVPSRQRRRSNSIFDIFDDPFFTPMELVKKNLKSKTLQIQAQPLPEEGKPTSFEGLVGEYVIDYSFNQEQKIKTNEAITFKFSVSGKGNIEMIHAPQIQFPPDFEVYEPKISYDKKVGDEGVSGSATFEYIIIPRNPGIYKINGFEYSFFDPKKECYVVKNIPETVLEIESSDTDNHQSLNNNADNKHFQMLGNDIEYIQTNNSHWKRIGENFLFSPFFWILLASEFLLAALALIFYRHRAKRNADIVGIRNRRAAKEARRCLKKAHVYMTDRKNDLFYIEISQALWGFLSNKLNIPQAELSIDNVKSRLETKGIPDTLVQQFIDTLNHCEFERFAPGGNSSQGMQNIYDEALDVISKIVVVLR